MMKITILKDILLNACLKCQKVISSKNVLPILDNIKFDVKLPGAVYLTASDLETYLSTYVVADIESEEDQSFCVGAKLLIDTLNKLPNIPLDIYLSNTLLEIVVPDAKYTMPVEVSGDFPLQRSSSVVHFEGKGISTDEFFSVVHSALPFVAKEELRRQMNGVNIVKNGFMFFNASDGNNLSTNILDVMGDGEFNIIVPPKPLANLKSFFEDKIDVDVTDFLSIRDGVTSVQITLIDERYPDVTRIIPTKNDSDIVFTAKKFDLVKLLKLANIYASKQSGSIVLIVKPNEIIIDAQDLDFSISATEHYDCKTSGEIKIGVNGNKLLECVKNLDVDMIEFRMTNPERAILLVDADDVNSHRMVIMSQQIN